MRDYLLRERLPPTGEFISYGKLAKSNSHLYVVPATNCDCNIIAEPTGDKRILNTLQFARANQTTDQGTIGILS
jgi:hypothetical protein